MRLRGRGRSCWRSSKPAVRTSHRVGEHTEALEAKVWEREKLVGELTQAMQANGHDPIPSGEAIGE